jgi:cardiolipin synthase
MRTPSVSTSWLIARALIAPAVITSSLSPLLAPAPPGVAGASPTWFTVYTEPQAGLGPVYSSILSARHVLDMTMYELDDPRAERDLAADASRGVDVRVLVDEAYAGGQENRQAARVLAQARVHVEWGPSSVIVHQKTIVVDNSAALIMTGNLTSRYYATTADFVVEDRRPVDVANIVRAFNDDWAGDLVDSPYRAGVRGQEGDLVFSPGSESALVGLISSARKSVETSSEEMRSGAIEQALAADARRGVDVEVLMTQGPAWAGAFDYLAREGVHIRLYPSSANSLYIHAKVAVVDGADVYVGSINYSTSSMVYNRELGIVTTNPSVLAPVAKAWRDWWDAAPIRLS